MSKEAFEAVIGKVLVETEFRYLLLADPDQALAGFDLTGEEASILKKMDDETLESLSSVLGECIRGRVWKEERIPEEKMVKMHPAGLDAGYPSDPS